LRFVYLTEKARVELNEFMNCHSKAAPAVLPRMEVNGTGK
jgi:hypothetical protein